MKHFFLVLLAVASVSQLTMAQVQNEVNRSMYPDYTDALKPDKSLMKPKTRTRGERPAYVNNQATKYFPHIFNQVGGSCGSASRISYMFAYEINCLRDVDGKLKENQYPSHFTWLLTNGNSGKEGMAMANGVPNAVTYGGFPYSSDFGIQDAVDKDFGWMQGYDKWFAAMHNRIEQNANFPISVQTEEGREAVKNWLWNHNGDADFPTGGVCGIGVASKGLKLGTVDQEHNSSRWEDLPTASYIKEWGPQIDHALTIVGYDDLITFDLDGNGVFGEVDKDEVGAWIIANSWGSWWCSTGLVYCPYKNAVPSSGSTEYYMPEVYYARKNYRPLRTYKILMEYSHRSELKLSAGISADTTATEPEQVTEFEHFKFAGNGTGNHSQEPAVPMLGKWADGRLHYEPMEFGYDLTDLSAGFDTRRPLKYFFIIESKAGAVGNGVVHDLSLIDYEFDREGIETPFPVGEGVTINNKGKKTIISVVVNGEPINAPRNVVMKDNQLTWEAPVVTSYVLIGYNIYSDGILVQTLDKDVTSYVPEVTGSWEVAAVYVSGEEEIESKRMKCFTDNFYGKSVTSNTVRTLSQSGFKVKDLMKDKYQNATLEFWIYPTALTNYNQQIGPGWGSFLFHATSSGSINVGWSTGARIVTANKTLVTKKWTHVAITVNNNLMTLYVNGEKTGQIAGSSGIGGFGDLNIGINDANGIKGWLDEVRFWNVTRTEREIQGMMYCQVADPKNTPGLLLELNMNEKSGVPVDSTGNYICEVYPGSQGRANANSLLTDKRTLTAKIEMPEGPHYVGIPVDVQNASSANAIKYAWINSEKSTDTLRLEAPSYIFETAGEKTIILKAYSMNGETAADTLTFNVDAMPVPVASFECPDNVLVSERITFINTTTPTDGCTYEWLMTGGSPEKASTVNAATTYSATGEVTVSLRAKNAMGTSVASKTITVNARAPLSAFSINQTTVLKGANIQLTDESKFSPTEWNWVVKDAMTHNVYSSQNPAFTMNEAGVYTVELTAVNEMGKNTYSKPRAITVCNADGGTGLNFSGTETVTFNNPIDLSKNNSMTIDYWFYPKNLQDTYNHIGGSKESFQIRTHLDGTMSIELANITFKSMPGLVTPTEWHHYAITFAKEVDPMYGMERVCTKIYKDGKHESTLNIPVRNWPAMPGKLTLGGEEAPIDGVIDEFRIWNKELSADEIRMYANSPIENVTDAETKNNLALYYQFNQSGGSVQDATSAANHGTRIGFGPDGDAWTPTFGIFYLNNTKRKDLSADYLTNYKTPFLHTGEKVSSADQFMYLLQDEKTSNWVAENGILENDVYTGFCVNVQKEDMLAVATKEYNFASMLTDHKLYQTITLPAGHYVFGAEPVEIYTDVENYVVVNSGIGLPNTVDLPREAMAMVPLNDLEASFSLYKDTEVSVGIVSNMRGESELHIRRFWLEGKVTNDTFEPTDICTPNVSASSVKFTPTIGGVIISSAVPANVCITNVNGAVVYRSTLCGMRTIALPAGFYISKGAKFIVR